MAHPHSVIDDDLHFTIDPDTRKITRASENPITIVQNDHNSERLTFEIPAVIDGHNMTLCDLVRIHFLNVSADNPDDNAIGVYEVDDLDILEGDTDTLLFTWLVHRESTGYAGSLSFAISFQCTSEKIEEDGSKSTIVEYAWNTLPDTEDVFVSAGMDNTDEIMHDIYYEVIDRWIRLIEVAGKAETTAAVNSITMATDNAKIDIRAFTEEVKEALSEQVLADTDFVQQTTGTSTTKVMSQDATTAAVESAKTFASQKVSDAEARLRSAVDDLENASSDIYDALKETPRYKRLTPVAANPNCYKLEKDKTYYVKLAYVPNREKWGTKIEAIHKYSMRDPSAGSYRYVDSKSVMLSDIGDNGTYTFTEYDNRYPNIYGYKIHVLSDGESYFDNTVDFHGMYCNACVDVHTMSNTMKTARHTFVNIILASTTLGGVAKENVEYDGIYLTFDTTTYPAGSVYEIGNALAENTTDIDVTLTANGISDIAKTSTSGLTDTYTITLDDGTQKTFEVTNGDGIKDVSMTDEDDYESTYCITLNSGSTFSFKAPNSNAIGVKTLASGSIIHAEDVSPATHHVNVKVHNTNMIQYPYGATFLNGKFIASGVTCSVDANTGKFTMSGTANKTSAFAVWGSSETPIMLEAGKTYTLSYNVEGANAALPREAAPSVYLTPCNTDREPIYGWEQKHLYSDERTVTFTSKDDYYASILIGFTGGVTYNDIVFSIQLEEGDTATEYTPYKLNGCKLIRCGKNMFDSSKLLEASGWTEKDGVYSGSPGTLHAIYGPSTGNPIFDQFDSNTQYTFSMEAWSLLTDAAPSSLHVRFVYSDNSVESINITSDSLTKYTYTSIVGKTLSGIYLSYNHNVKTYLQNIQLEKGSVATAYESYSGTEYTVLSNGRCVPTVRSVSPVMTLFTNMRWITFDAAYNVDQTAAFNKHDVVGWASETQISEKNRTDLSITPQHLDHAVKSSTIQRMTDNREADLASIKVSNTFGPDAGPDPEHLPVSYDAIKSYIASQFEKLTPKTICVRLAPGEEYVLKQNHSYEIHGYGDNCLQVLGAEGANLDKNVLQGIEFVDDIDAMISSSYYEDTPLYWQMFRCWIKVDDAWRKKFDWQHNPLLAVKVKNVHETGYAYVYDYGVHDSNLIEGYLT